MKFEKYVTLGGALAFALAVSPVQAEPVATTGIPVSAYVQDGLIAQWDGIENAGAGLHDSAATSWVELKQALATTATALTFDGTSAVFNGVDTSGTLITGSLPAALVAISNGTFTANVCVKPNAYKQYAGLFQFGVNGNDRYFSLSEDVHKYGGVDSFIGAFQYKRNAWNADNCYSQTAITLGMMHSLSAIADGSKHRLYLDGSKTFEASAGTFVRYASTTFQIGRYSTNKQRANMNLYGVRLYSRVLNAADIAWNDAIDDARFLRPGCYRWNDITETLEVLLTVKAFGAAVSVNGGTAAELVTVWVEYGASVDVVVTCPSGQSIQKWGGGSPVPGALPGAYTLTVNKTCELVAYVGTGTRSWTGDAADGLWSTDGNWSPEGAPEANEIVSIASGKTVLLDSSTPNLSALELDGTLTLTNWSTCVQASSVLVNDGGVLTSAGAFTTAQMSNRVLVACRDFTLASGASINVNYKGWRTATTSEKTGWGPGGGDFDGGGGAYGGTAGHGWGNTHVVHPKRYGSVTEPTDPGSGAGAGPGDGGKSHAGGAVRIDATGHVQLDGTISANGGDSSSSQYGGGSGGSVLVICRTLGGSGMVSACGGAAGSSNRGGGGGGRIALRYDVEAQAAYTGIVKPTIRCADGRTAGSLDMSDDYPYGGPGSVYLPDNRFFPGEKGYWTQCSGEYFIPGWTTMTLDSLDLSRTLDLRFHDLTINIAGDLILRDTARLFLTNCTVNVGGNLIVSNTQFNVEGWSELKVAKNLNVGAKGQFIVTGGITNNSPWAEYTSKISVGKNFTIAGASAKYRPTSDKKTGGSVFLETGSLIVATNGVIDATKRGWGGINSSSTDYTWGYGMGTARYTAGASYGAMGGQPGSYTYPNYLRGPYGDMKRPIYPGSDAGKHWGSYVGGWGGGLVWVEAQKKIVVDGKIEANGGACGTNEGGGGSGGAIFLTCHQLEGKGSLSAIGGNCKTGGSGSGGRIALYAHVHKFTGTHSVTNGVATYDNYRPAYQGKPGTFYQKTVGGMMVILR